MLQTAATWLNSTSTNRPTGFRSKEKNRVKWNEWQRGIFNGLQFDMYASWVDILFFSCVPPQTELLFSIFQKCIHLLDSNSLDPRVFVARFLSFFKLFYRTILQLVRFAAYKIVISSMGERERMLLKSVHNQLYSRETWRSGEDRTSSLVVVERSKEGRNYLWNEHTTMRRRDETREIKKCSKINYVASQISFFALHSLRLTLARVSNEKVTHTETS